MALRHTLAYLLLLMMSAWMTSAAMAAIEVRHFDDPVLEKRYHDLTSSMRCPLCENQAISDSNAPIAADMRERIDTLLNEGRSDSEIIDHMVQRFGEYILYNPRLENRTYLLWGLPIALLVLGFVVIVLIVRARRHATTRALNAEERARLAQLMKRGDDA